MLAPLSPTSEVEKLRATARISGADSDVSELTAALEADPDNDATRIELGRALAAAAEFEPALDHFLSVVKRKNASLEAARTAMVDVFEVLGADHPLSLTYRRELASALF